MYQRNTYDYVPRKKKVKHVKLFDERFVGGMEKAINTFVDEHPEYKILGIRISPVVDEPRRDIFYIGCVTYLEDAKDDVVDVEDDYGTDEEGDID